MSGARRVFKIVLISAASVVGLLLLIIALVAVFLPREAIRAAAQEQAADFVNRPVRIGDVGLALFPSIGVDVSGIAIENDPALSDEPIISIDRVVVSVGIWPLIASREVHVGEVAILRPRIAIVVAEDGTSNLDDLMVETPAEPEPEPDEEITSEPSALPVGVQLERFRIVDGAVSFVDRQGDVSLSIGSINETLALSIDADASTIAAVGHLTLDRIAAETADQGIGPLDVAVGHDVSLDLAADTVAFAVDLDLAGIPMTASGTVDALSTAPDVTVALETGRIELARLLDQLTLPADHPLAGTRAGGAITLAAHAHVVPDAMGPDRPLDVNARLVLDDLSLNHPDMPEALDRLAGEIVVTPTSAEIRDLAIRAGQTSIDVGAQLDAWQSGDPQLAQATVTGSVVLDEIADIVELPESTSVGGTTSFRFNASGPINDPLDMDVSGRITLSDISASTPDLPVPVSRLAGAVDITKSRISIADIGVWLGRSEIHLAEVSVSDYLAFAMPDEYSGRTPRVAFTVRGPLLDLDEFMPPTEEVEETPPLADTAVVIPPMELPAVVIEGAVRIDRIVMLEAEFTDLRVDMGMRDNRASIDGRAGAFDGSAAFRGRFDLSSPEAASYAFRWNIESVQANSMVGTFTDFEDRLYGSAFTSGSVDGSGNTYGDIKRNLTLDTDFRAGNGYLNNWEVVQKTSAKIAQGVDRVKSGWGTSAVRRMGLGTDRFDYGQLDGDASLRSEVLTLENIGLVASDQNWRTNGTISSAFDTVSALDIRTELTFSPDITLELANAAASAVSLATPVTGAEIARYLDPPNRLRVTVPIRGTTVEPDVGLPDLLTPLRNAATNAAREKLQQVRQEAEQEVREQVEERTEEVVEEASKRLRGLLGR